MSDLPPEALTYETVVAEYFLGLRGAGLMLSPLDLELIRTWERRGLPVAVVCRGLRRGLDDALRLRGPTAPAPRSVRALRLSVEDEWGAYRRGRVGDAPAPPDERSAGVARLDAARGLLAAEVARSGNGTAARTAYRAASELLDTAPSDLGIDAVDAWIGKTDDLLVRAWLAALPHRARATLGRRCALRAGPRPTGTRRVEYRATLRAYLVEAIREAGLLCLRGSV